MPVGAHSCDGMGPSFEVWRFAETPDLRPWHGPNPKPQALERAKPQTPGPKPQTSGSGRAQTPDLRLWQGQNPRPQALVGPKPQTPNRNGGAYFVLFADGVV